ncbi:MAG: hypothetical protein ACJ76F_01075 [Bacteroidia bacterium]
MGKRLDISVVLAREKRQAHRHEDKLLEEARRLIIAEQFSDKYILQNLKSYNRSFELVNEEESREEDLFRIEEIRNTCINYRLKFLDSQLYPGEIPYEAILKIKNINKVQHKDIRHFKILAPAEDFNEGKKVQDTLLFAKTVYGNYCLIHQWGTPLKASRKLTSFPFRNFECLIFCVLLFTFCLTMAIPTRRLTTDVKADYLSMYRIAAFFHLLILNGGFTIYLAVAFRLKLSSTTWDSINKKRS